MRHYPYKTQQRVLDTSKEMTNETDTRKTSNICKNYTTDLFNTFVLQS
jgi:hypothetical protein